MNEVATKWVEALRSGEFQQTTTLLHDDCGYCCLGVLCELYRRETGSGRWGSAVYGYEFIISGDDPETTTLPHSVHTWAGLTDHEGSFEDKEMCTETLINRNDTGASFEEIANIIESEPSGLFEEDA